MNWINKLERKFGKYAISNLMLYITIMYAAGFLIVWINPTFYNQYLALDANAILHGQIWRIFTFIMEPPTTSLLWIIFSLMLYYFIGSNLERVWGAFRFNLYFFSGVLFHVIAAIIVYLTTGISMQMGTTYLNLSLFLVFAALFPDVQFMIYFVIPVKVKWLAILDFVLFGYAILQAFMPAYGGDPTYGIWYKANALAAFVSLLNFLIFYFGTRKASPYAPKQLKRKHEFKQNIRRAEQPMNMYPNGARHKCAICGRTELDDENLEFRYCSKCNGNYEYCQDHLFTHKHVE